MRCPKNLQCPKQPDFIPYDSRPFCRRCEKDGKDRKKRKQSLVWYEKA